MNEILELMGCLIAVVVIWIVLLRVFGPPWRDDGDEPYDNLY